MYLQQTEAPSFNTNKIWIALSRHVSTLNTKNDKFRLDYYLNETRITITSNITNFNQKDKLIFEMVLYQRQLKNYPDFLEVDLEKLCVGLGYKPYTREKQYLFDRLKALSSFRFDIVTPTETYYIDFSDINCSIDKNSNQIITINFTGGLNRTSLNELFPKKGIKKYILPLKGEYQLLIAEFLQTKTKIKSIKKPPIQMEI